MPRTDDHADHAAHSPEEATQMDASGVPDESLPATANNAGAASQNAVLPVSLAPDAMGASSPWKMSLPPGWVQLSPSAVKLLITLAAIGTRGTATQSELADLCGLSERTATKALAELQDHGLLVYEGNRGEGTTWHIAVCPMTLPDAARERYAAQLEQKAETLQRRQAELEQDRQALDDALSGAAQERFRETATVAAQAAQEGQSTGTAAK